MKRTVNKNLQTEVDACYLYKKLAEQEQDSTVASVFRQMSDIEKTHAEAFLRKKNGKEQDLLPDSLFPSQNT